VVYFFRWLTEKLPGVTFRLETEARFVVSLLKESSMKAIALVPGTKNVRIADIDEPKIASPTQVKVRVLEVGICGTDREEVAGGRADAPAGEKELIIGHEMLGQVVEVGEKVKSLKRDDLVVIMVRRPCNACEPCKKGCSDMCASGQYTERGIKGLHGFDTEFVVDEEEYMIHVPASLRSIAVLTEPTTVLEKAIDHAARLQVARLPVEPDPKSWLNGKRALVAGLGPIGLLACMVLRLRGARVTGMGNTDPLSDRPRFIERLGCKYVQSSKIKPGEPHDIIVEAAGVPKLDFELIDLLGINGVYVLTGVPGDSAALSVDAARLMRQMVLKNQILFGSVNAGKAHFKQAVADLAEAEKKWPGVMEQLITSRTPYAEYRKVLTTRNREEIKAVLKWSA